LGWVRGCGRGSEWPTVGRGFGSCMGTGRDWTLAPRPGRERWWRCAFRSLQVNRPEH